MIRNITMDDEQMLNMLKNHSSTK